ncbi:MAG: TldD/PmbA family protein [Candidatus Asgardarchaeum sp.]
MSDIWKIESINDKALKIGLKEGVSQIEVFSINGHMRNVYVENSEIHLATDNSWMGLGVKAIIGKRVGFISGIISKDEDIERIVKESISLAKISPEDKDFKSLPSPAKVQGIKDIGYDENIVSTSMDYFIEFAKNVVSAAEHDDVKVMNGLVRVNNYTLCISNSLGINLSRRGTFIFVHFLAKKEIAEGVEKVYSAILKNLDPSKIGEELHRKTVISAKAKAFKGAEKVTTIIKPLELEALINSTVSSAASGENINKKRSVWLNKIGENVASEMLTIIDNPFLPEGPRSSLFDDEGVPTKKKAIIEKGVLKSYLFDSYNAYIANVEPTGNGFRIDTRTIETAHQNPTYCRPSNLEILPTSKTLDDLISEIKFGVLIEKFAAPMADPYTGNFGLEVRSAILIENGELTQPIRHALLTGNFYEGLKNISGIANDSRLIENVKTPSIRFEGFQLVG